MDVDRFDSLAVSSIWGLGLPWSDVQLNRSKDTLAGIPARGEGWSRRGDFLSKHLQQCLYAFFAAFRPSGFDDVADQLRWVKADSAFAKIMIQIQHQPFCSQNWVPCCRSSH